MAKYKITQIKSTNSATKRQIANLESLGIHRMRQTVTVEINPVSTGMLAKVRHLVAVEEIN